VQAACIAAKELKLETEAARTAWAIRCSFSLMLGEIARAPWMSACPVSALAL
jgi:hypothetical protein